MSLAVGPAGLFWLETSKLHSPLQPTLSLQDAQQTDWDVVVVGAGPAGSMAARSTARSGQRVLLIDRDRFPRSKVCGCCVNGAALGLLDQSERAWIESQGVGLQSYELASGGQVARVPLSGGIAISRNLLDSHLIETAIRSGAHFLDSTQGILEPNSSSCRLDLKRRHEEGKVGCKIAVLATGLVGKQKDAGDAREWKSRSYIGAGAILEEGTAGFEPGTVSMACHRWGYVGIVQLEDGRLDLAAAFDIGFVKRLGGLSNAACRVLSESGLSVPCRMKGAHWQGTVKLTHQRAKLFGARYLVAGDAAGYVEPFTGEGIAWAMASGHAVSKFAHRAVSRPISVVGPAWSQEYRRILGHRMRFCKAVSFLLRQPAFLRIAVRVLQMSPRLAGPIERSLSKPFALSN